VTDVRGITATGRVAWRGLCALACLVVLGTSSPGQAASAPMACTVPAGFFDDQPFLPRTAKALAQGGRVLIVAMGSASTQGNAAGSQELTWPGRLSAALAKRYPAAQLTVVNRGSGRLTAVDLAARLERDVLDLHPTLVILDVGTTDAVRNTDIDDFRDAVQSSIEQLQADGPEVVLMDMQFSRRTSFMINFERYIAVLREVASVYAVPLFSRFDLMKHWSEENGAFDTYERDADKRRAFAVWLYGCIGDAMETFLSRRPMAGQVK
jgi:lysophospholipase L1-like esterase